MDSLEPEVREYLSDDEGEPFSYPDFSEDMSTAIVCDNLPKIPMAKYDKLLGVLKRIFGQTGTIERIVMPDASGTTMGIAFIEFATAEEAAKAIRLTDGYALDKSHVFKVCAYAEMKRLADLSETYSPPAPQEFAPRLNPCSWLGDVLHRDQFVIRYNNETEIKWCERSSAPTLEYD